MNRKLLEGLRIGGLVLIVAVSFCLGYLWNMKSVVEQSEEYNDAVNADNTIYYKNALNYKELIDDINNVKMIHNQEVYDVNTNNCIDFTNKLNKRLRDKGYNPKSVSLPNIKEDEPGHRITMIMLYMDGTNGVIMNYEDLEKGYGKDYNINNLEVWENK